MRASLRLLCVPLLMLGCQVLPHAARQRSVDFQRYFDDAGVRGVFLLYDVQQRTYLSNDFARAGTAFPPASTYKIMNSLVALETGVVRDADQVFPWDGVQRDFPGWNQDQTLRTGMRYSAVWIYQELARRIGQERMQHYVDAVAYGNGDLSGGIDRFWLDGGLRITPRQEVDFVLRLFRGDLPFSPRAMETVRDIMVVERGDGYVLRGKTGWAASARQQIGWFVGYLERGRQAYVFALNADLRGPQDLPVRLGITRRILADLELVPAGAPGN